MPQAYLPLLNTNRRFKVFFGGRGSGKSESAARAIIIKAMLEPCKILCAREFQNSISESVYGILTKLINELELPFIIRNTEIECVNGSRITFKGLARNIQSVKSMHDYKYVWVEEAEAVSHESWNILIPTIRADESEIWVTFNPRDENDATYSRFVKPYLADINANGFYDDGDLIYVAKVNYDQNPFFPSELRRDSDLLKITDYKRWLHVYGGEPYFNTEDSIIEPEWFDAAVDAHVKMHLSPRGASIVAFDPSDTGKDAKAVAVRQGIVITAIHEWNDGDITDATSKMMRIAAQSNATHIVYDSIGNGAAVKTYATVTGGIPSSITFLAFNGAEIPDDSNLIADSDILGTRTIGDLYRNKRAQYYWALRERFRKTHLVINKGMVFPHDELISIDSSCKHIDKLKSELLKVSLLPFTAGLIQVTSKDVLRKRGIASPNIADAVMMLYSKLPQITHRYHREKITRRR